MPITQKQIAEILGLSRQQVGLALQGKGTVSEATRRRVRETARSLGYEMGTNNEARRLIARRYRTHVPTGIFAILYASPPSVGEPALRGMPFFIPYFEGAEIEAARRQRDVLLSAARPGGLPRLIRERLVDGVVCIERTPVTAQILALGIPVVTLGAHSPDTISLIPNDREGMRLAVRHLVHQGHRDIAYLHLPVQSGKSAPAGTPEAERLLGYRLGMKECRVTINEALITASLPVMASASGAAAVEHLLGGEERFTALVCYNDMLAFGAVRRLQEAGLRVPEDISVVGFDDISLPSGFSPALTSVYFDRLAMGRRAIQLLCEHAAGTLPPARLERFPVEIVERQSTRPFPPGSPTCSAAAGRSSTRPIVSA